MIFHFRASAAWATLASILTITGCATSVPSGVPAPARQSGVEGQWIDQGGIALSTFNNGQFVSVDARTGAKLSEGTYRMAGNQAVDISMTSLARAMQVNVNCAVANPNQLNCTNSMGTNFVLTRR